MRGMAITVFLAVKFMMDSFHNQIPVPYPAINGLSLSIAAQILLTPLM
jgi:hypothetical protein